MVLEKGFERSNFRDIISWRLMWKSKRAWSVGVTTQTVSKFFIATGMDQKQRNRFTHSLISTNPGWCWFARDHFLQSRKQKAVLHWAVFGGETVIIKIRASTKNDEDTTSCINIDGRTKYSSLQKRVLHLLGPPWCSLSQAAKFVENITRGSQRTQWTVSSHSFKD